MTSKRIFARIRLAFAAFTLVLAGFVMAEAAIGDVAPALACGAAENPCELPALVVTAARAAEARLVATPIVTPVVPTAQS